jgi:hypothetical protein
MERLLRLADLVPNHIRNQIRQVLAVALEQASYAAPRITACLKSNVASGAIPRQHGENAQILAISAIWASLVRKVTMEIPALLQYSVKHPRVRGIDESVN